ncbi:CTLH/CRA C-terminal to lish motif domain-containing protein [Gloeopeniophorella convolvens]|nr:CTLH/CRA C-terminal to lish motif domain-containing protein [Gloeopeniophorella convolvens]
MSSPSVRGPTPQQLRALILDYLLQRCYTRTARAFAADSTIRHLDADGDEILRPECEGDSHGITDETLRQADQRRDVQISILSGHIDDAIGLLDAKFPAILDRSLPQGPEPDTASDDSTDTGPAQAVAKQPQPEFVGTVLPFTIEPAHLYLDLRILAFIEASRTRPLPYPSAKAAPIDVDPIPRISTPNNLRPETDSDAHLAQLLKYVYELYDCAQALKDPHERAEYQHELSTVCSLLAYKVPEQSPVANYFSQERRQTVADEINSAILHRAGLAPISRLELLIRYTTAIWSYMNDHGYRVAPSRGWPAGVAMPSRHQPVFTLVSSNTKPGTSKKEDLEVAPSFDLKHFLSP